MCVSYDFLSCFVWLGKIGCKIETKRDNLLSNGFLFAFIVKKTAETLFFSFFREQTPSDLQQAERTNARLLLLTKALKLCVYSKQKEWIIWAYYA